MSEAASHPFPGAREVPVHEFTVPLDGASGGRLEIRGGAAHLTVRAAPGATDLLRSRFTGISPEIHAAAGRVTVRARFGLEDWLRSFFFGGPPPAAPAFGLEDWFRAFFHGDRGAWGGELLLTDAVPWHVALRGGARDLEADLRGLKLTGLDLAGGAAGMVVDLPRPSGLVTVRLRGGAASIAFRRPKGVAARVDVLGGMASFRFDHQELGAVGGRTRMQSPGFAEATDRYEFDITGGASDLVVEEAAA
ncbi:MAG TPA: hypothetical protein VIG99_31680 [Myxococcaceae bacterium]|jgi:hypothetical protein